MGAMETAIPPIEAWSAILRNPRAIKLAHYNPDVRLWWIDCASKESYLMRAFGRRRPGASLADEYRVLVHLQAAGVPVAVPIVTDDAALCATRGDDSYVLLPRIAADAGNHELLPDAGDICFRIGESIGQLHLALSEYPWPVTSYEHDVTDAFDKLYLDLPENINVHRSEASARLKGLPVQLIHGDCNSRNVLLHEGKVSAFIDLDHLPIGQRMYDLGYYLADRIRKITARVECEEPLGAAFLSVVGRYVAGYDAVNPLSDAERAAVSAAILAAEIALTSWSYRLRTAMAYRAGADEQGNYEHGVRSLKWISRNFIRMETIIS